MKIYHTETQKDYDDLMIEMEAKEYTWGRMATKPSQINAWKLYKNQTCIMLDGDIIRHSALDHYQSEYSFIPIIKYKAKVKVDEKMKFTKENVKRIFKEYRDKRICYINVRDLEDKIMNLDDTPEKVGVPKFVADVFSSELHFEYEIQESRNIPHVLSAAFSEVSSNKNIEFLQWVKRHPDKYVMVVKYGCIIEPEQLYYIPLPHLETTLGIQQVLSKRKNDTNYFASRPASALQQRYTKEELEQVPEIYKPYAKPIEEEEEE